MSTLIGQTRWADVRINQMLDLGDDSTHFINANTGEQLFHVDSSGYLSNGTEQIGKFSLCKEQWVLMIGNEIFLADDPKNGLFRLPEFELVAIVKLLESFDK